MGAITRAHVLLSAMAVAAASLGVMGAGPPVAAAGASPRPTVAAKQAATSCQPTGNLPGRSAGRTSKRGLTLGGPARPYTTEPAAYCGTLTLPGKPTPQPLVVEVNGKVVATAVAGVDRSWHTWLTLPTAKVLVIRAIWHKGRSGQLVSNSLTAHPNPAADTRPTSLDLIARALTAHRISRPAALIDQVFALLAPAKLPRSLVGSKPLADLSDSGVLAAVADGWRTLSAAQQASVLPYLGPYKFPKAHGRDRPDIVHPREACSRDWVGFGGRPGSVILPPFGSTVPRGWAFIGTTHFKIWYLTKDIPFTTAAESKASAQYLAAEVETVWTKETKLFGRTPISDAHEKCNGGDGRMDIYVYRQTFSTAGLTESFAPWECHATPAYMVMAPDFANAPWLVQYVLAHEFFHTIELSYNVAGDCLTYGWLGEATGTWVVDYVYPSNNAEQHNAVDYFNVDFRHPLYSTGFNGKTGYDDYIYLFFLARQFNPGVIREIWDNTEHADPIHAIMAAVPGGIAASWYQFALDNWNRAPLDNYTAWDDIPYMLKDNPFAEIDLGGKHSKVFSLGEGGYDLDPLSSNYLYITVTDKNVAQLTFTHYGFTKPPKPGVRLDALIELSDGTFRQEDWTAGADKTFCRENADQDVVSVLLMYSNGELGAFPRFVQGDGAVKATDACVPTGYTGTVKNVLTINNSSEDLTQTANASVTFKYDSAVSNPGLGQYQFDTTGGKVKEKVDGTSGGCTISGSGSFAIAKWQPPTQPAGPGGQVIANDGISPKSPYSGDGSFTGAPPFTDHWVCPTSSFDGSYFMAGQWWATDNGTPTNKIKFRQQLTGSYTMTGPDGVTSTWTWNLRPIFGS